MIQQRLLAFLSVKGITILAVTVILIGSFGWYLTATFATPAVKKTTAAVSMKTQAKTTAVAKPAVIATTQPNTGATSSVTSTSTATLNWSDPTTWGGKLPTAGSTVIIPAGKTVTLDVDSPALNGLQVDGTLIFAPKDLKLSANWIIVHGTFQIGTATQPFKQHADITLTGNNTTESIMNMGTKVIGVMGTLDLYGNANTVTWAHLASTAAAGSKQISLERAVDWHVGDTLVIASTDFPQDAPHSEKHIIAAISGTTITLDSALQFQHWSAVESGVPEKAEVGLLSHNITIHGDAGSTSNGFGGHVMVGSGGHAHISAVGFQFMGQKGILGRYPVHFHEAGDTSAGSFVKGSSIYDAFNRCVTIHGTNKIQVEGNVTYNTLGHCFYLEEGDETGNTFTNNLAMLVEGTNVPLVPQDDQPAGFWITNPNNTLTGNVAAETGSGFWYPILDRPIPFGREGQNLAWMDSIIPRDTPLGKFENNVSHTAVQSLFVELGFSINGCDRNASRNSCTKTNGMNTLAWHTTGEYTPKVGGKEDGASVAAEFKSFVAYKNSGIAVWFRGDSQHFLNPLLADNLRSATFAGGSLGVGNLLDGGTFVGESANQATRIPVYSGFRHYDSYVGLRNSTFHKFSGNNGKNAALNVHLPEYNLSISFVMENLKFDAGVQRVYMDQTPTTELNNQQYAMAAWFDKDGSVTGQKQAWVVSNNPLMYNNTCQKHADWNAYVCPNASYLPFSVWASMKQPVIQRQDNASMQFGVGQNDPVSPYVVALANNSPTDTTNIYTVKPTGDVPTGYTIDSSPVPFYDSSFAPYNPGASIVIALPWTGQKIYAYHKDWPLWGTNTPMNPAASMAALQASPKGDDVYYRNGNTVYIKLVRYDATAAGFAGQNFSLCSTQNCV